MPRRFAAALSRALGRPTPGADPHFHQGATGAPAACFVAGCDRPQLEVR